MNNNDNYDVEKYIKQMQEIRRMSRLSSVISVPQEKAAEPATSVAEQAIVNEENKISSSNAENPVDAVKEEIEAVETSYLKAQVYSGNEALPIPNASIVVKRNGNIVAYGVTDKTGTSRVIPLPAPPRENSLNPYSTNKTMEYFVDIHADNFVDLKNLPVSQVGGATSLLVVNLVPEAEGAR